MGVADGLRDWLTNSGPCWIYVHVRGVSYACQYITRLHGCCWYQKAPYPVILIIHLRHTMTNTIPEGLRKIYDATRAELSREDKDFIARAYEFTEIAHDGQVRKSGEPYFNHLVATAVNLAELGMDEKVIAAGLLHDSVEDGMALEENLEKTFGKEVAFLVDGVTKMGRFQYRGMKRHTESLRKLLIATSKDIRVIIIKLADRLHNMQTLEHVRPDKRERIATETLEIYAPLAYRLGITTLSRQLEDLSFPYILPEEHKQVQAILKERSKQTFQKLEKTERSIKKRLGENNIRDFRISNRIKGIYSLYKKLLRKNWDIEKIYDIAAMRIIVKNTADCYQVLGIIHQYFRPMPGRIKDYIAVQKPNGYQSIHTTIFTGDGGLVEIQIRTERMHQNAEFGAAAHLLYKTEETPETGDAVKDMSWIQRMVQRLQNDDSKSSATVARSEQPEWLDKITKRDDQHLEEDEESFERYLKEDFFKHRIFVFTPLGDVIDLPEGSTPLDFAFMVHTDVGKHTAGAKVGGKLVSLDTKLQNGDIVEIVTKSSAKPSTKWIDMAITTEAKRKIRNVLAKNEQY